MGERQHANHSRSKRVLCQHYTTCLRDSQFRTRKTSRGVGNTRRASRLTYLNTPVSQKRDNCSPGLRCSKIWRNNDLPICQCWMSSDNLRRLCYVRNSLCLTTNGGESLLKMYKKVVCCHSSLKLSYDVKIPERHTFAQQRFAAYDVAGNTITNIISQLSGQRSCHFAWSILQRCCRRTPPGALFAGINSHHCQRELFFVSDYLWPWIRREEW